MDVVTLEIREFNFTEWFFLAISEVLWDVTPYRLVGDK
jgi:hypothetical protein